MQMELIPSVFICFFSAVAAAKTEALSPLPLSLSPMIKTDPPAGHTKAKLIIPEMGYMSILW